MESSKRRWPSAIIVTLLLLPLLTAGVSAPWAHAQQPACRTFTETGKTLCGRFLEYWNANGGLAQQGFPISEPLLEISDTDGKTYSMQYLERAVFELHPENPPTSDVLLSLLGVFLYRQKYPGPAGAPSQKPNMNAGSVLFKETGKRLGGTFLDYWKANGGLAQQGLPISDEFVEISDLNGKPYLVQYFERAVFEYHPEEQMDFRVLLSQLGTFQQRAIYADVVFPPSTGQLTIWHGYSGSERLTLEEVVQRLTLNRKDFKVNLVAVPLDQLLDKFKVEGAKGAGPDLLLAPSEWAGDLVQSLAIAPLDGKEGIGNILPQLAPPAVSASKYNGKLYGLPVLMNTVSLIYNKDLVKNIPANTEQLLAESARLVGGGGGKVKYGLALRADFYHTVGYNFAYGGKFLISPNRVDLTTQGTIDWLTWLQKAGRSQGIYAGVGGLGIDQEVDSLFKSGAAAMVIAGPEALRGYQLAMGIDKVGVALPPLAPAGGGQVVPFTLTANYGAAAGQFAPFVGTDSYYLSANSRNTKAALEFLRYVASQGVEQRFVSRGGQLPAHTKASSRDQANFVEQANQGTSMPNVPNVIKLWPPADKMVADVVQGKASPQEAAQTATDAMNAILSGAQPPPPGSNCELLSSSDVPKQLPGEGTTSSSLFVPFNGTIEDVNVIGVNINARQAFRASLVSPSGRRVDLFDWNCPEPTNVSSLTLDDEAAANIRSAGCQPQLSGSFAPASPLSEFDGTDAQGTWTLVIEQGMAGRSRSSKLVVPSPVPTDTRPPEPTDTPTPEPTDTPTPRETDTPVAPTLAPTNTRDVRPTSEPGSEPTDTPSVQGQLNGWGLQICLRTGGLSAQLAASDAQIRSCVSFYPNVSAALP